jgi:hypothetical protein
MPSRKKATRFCAEGAGPESILPPFVRPDGFSVAQLRTMARSFHSRPGMTVKSLRQKSNFPCPIKPESTVQSSPQKYFAAPDGQITATDPRYPVPEKGGVSRSSRTLGAGCDGRLGAHRTKRIEADGEAVWS